ncbi:hypothetical protein ACCO45_000675 [Purpureocillium lilacinum]|uniref:Uncharacterized protein n=1 Tax=Purpureocillium lilacinum TaxID=33203 RepID=A0ACC4E7Q6_PURLI
MRRCNKVFRSRPVAQGDRQQPEPRSGEADKLGIPRAPIRADAVLLEAALHVSLARLVKCHAPLLHDLEDLGLARVVQAGTTVARLHIADQVKVAAGEAGLDVAGEAAGQPRVYVSCAGQADFGDVMAPVRAGEEESRRRDDEEQRETKEDVRHGGRTTTGLGGPVSCCWECDKECGRRRGGKSSRDGTTLFRPGGSGRLRRGRQLERAQVRLLQTWRASSDPFMAGTKEPHEGESRIVLMGNFGSVADRQGGEGSRVRLGARSFVRQELTCGWRTYV